MTKEIIIWRETIKEAFKKMTLDLIQGPANHHLCAQSSELPIFIIKVLFNRATLYFIYCIWLLFYSGSPTPPPLPLKLEGR